MHHLNSISPDAMTREERINEAAYILALGLLRLLNACEPPEVASLQNGDISLDFIARQRVHSDVATSKGKRL